MNDAVSFDQTIDFDYGRADRIARDVVRIIANNPSPYTYVGTSTYLIGGDAVAVLDPGPDNDDHLAAILDAIAGRTVSHILLTHTHKDHCALLPRLKAETGAPTVGLAYRSRPGQSGDQGLDASHDQTFRPDIEASEDLTLQIDGRPVTVTHTPGHADNHVVFALDDEKLLFSGDHVMAWSTTVVAPPDGNMGDYFRSLERLIGAAYDIYWPGHGGPVRNPDRFVRSLLTHRRMRETQILDCLKAGLTDMDRIVGRIYPELDRKLIGAASLSTRAHLEHLVERGVVEAEPAANDAQVTGWRLIKG